MRLPGPHIGRTDEDDWGPFLSTSVTFDRGGRGHAGATGPQQTMTLFERNNGVNKCENTAQTRFSKAALVFFGN